MAIQRTRAEMLTKKQLFDGLAGLPDDAPVFIKVASGGLASINVDGAYVFDPDDGEPPIGILETTIDAPGV